MLEFCWLSTFSRIKMFWHWFDLKICGILNTLLLLLILMVCLSEYVSEIPRVVRICEWNTSRFVISCCVSCLLCIHSANGDATSSDIPPMTPRQTSIMSDTKTVIQGLDTLKNEHNQVSGGELGGWWSTAWQMTDTLHFIKAVHVYFCMWEFLENEIFLRSFLCAGSSRLGYEKNVRC